MKRIGYIFAPVSVSESALTMGIVAPFQVKSISVSVMNGMHQIIEIEQLWSCQQQQRQQCKHQQVKKWNSNTGNTGIDHCQPRTESSSIEL